MYEGKQECPVEAEITYQDGRKGVLKTSLKIRSVDRGTS
jgi:hypothetical protein